jgi:hypothetical protein
MGSARWDPSDWATYATTTAGKSIHDVFSSRDLHPSLDPRRIACRESRDSALNPASTALIVALDVTGSMGMVADALARQGLGTMVEEVLRRKPVTDPHILCMGVGDAACDHAPLQVTQFEADIRIAEQLEQIWLEKGGGGNTCESYDLPWYFAAMHTSIDCFEQRGKKGYLFTVGDEEAPAGLTSVQIARVIGDRVQNDLGPRELLTMASRMYHVFHVIVEEGSYAGAHLPKVVDSWTALLGQRVLRLADHRRLAEVIVSAIQVTEGADRLTVTDSWPKDTALVVRRAIGALSAVASADTGVVRF